MVISCINCSANSRAKWISMHPTQSSLFVEVKCLPCLLGVGRERGYVIEWIWINRYFMDRTHNFKAVGKNEAFIRVPLSNLPLSLLINLLWNGVLQSLQEHSPSSTFSWRKNISEHSFRILSPYIPVWIFYTHKISETWFLKLPPQKKNCKFKTSLIRRNNSYKSPPRN